MLLPQKRSRRTVARRRPQFSLAMALYAVLGLAVFLGALRIVILPRLEEADRIAMVNDASLHILIEPDQPQWFWKLFTQRTVGRAYLINFCNHRSASGRLAVPTPEELRAVGRWERLQSVSLSGEHVTDETIRRLRASRRLQTLRLVDTSVTSEGLAALQDIGALEALRIRGLPSELGEGGSDHAVELVSSIVAMRQLRDLALAGDGVSDDTIELLVELSALEYLRIESRRISDEGVALLKNLPQLRHVVLLGEEISIEGLAEFTDCDSLQSLGFGVGDVPIGVRELALLLPGVNVQEYVRAEDGSWDLVPQPGSGRLDRSSDTSLVAMAR